MSFGIEAVLFPVFVLVGLTFVLMFWMASLRVGALQRGEVRMGDIALRQPAWPERATQVANAYHNQLELPLLFYVLVILAMFTRKADTFFVVMSWMFVTARLAHAAIHVSGNDVRRRFYAFAVSAVLLLIMWIVFALRLLFAGL
jgi:hypothetical protein